MGEPDETKTFSWLHYSCQKGLDYSFPLMLGLRKTTESSSSYGREGRLELHGVETVVFKKRVNYGL